MAVLPTRAHQSANVARALGDPYHGDRVSFRIRRRLLLHFSALALLDQSRHRGNPYGIRRDTRGKVSLIGREIISLAILSSDCISEIFFSFNEILQYSPSGVDRECDARR